MKIIKAKEKTLKGAGQFYQLIRGHQVADPEELRQRFAGTVFGRLLNQVETGDTEGLFQSISQIEGLLLSASQILAHCRPTRTELLSDVQRFARCFGLKVDSSLLRNYRYIVSRTSLAKVYKFSYS